MNQDFASGFDEFSFTGDMTSGFDEFSFTGDMTLHNDQG